MAKTALINAVPTKDTMLQHIVQIWKRLREIDNGNLEIEWGSIAGTLSDQADLQAALNLKASTATVSAIDSALDDKADLTDGDIEFATGKGPVVLDRTLGTKKRLGVDDNAILQEDKA